MNQKENRGPSKRGLYRRSSDDDIFYYVGKFSFLTAEEIAALSKRNVISLRKRLRQLVEAGYLDRDEGETQRQEFFEEIRCKHCKKINRIVRTDGRMKPKPYFHWLTEKGGEKASALLERPIAWRSKKPSRLDHDRALTTIHLALDRAFGDDLIWLQQKDDVKVSVMMGEMVSFYPDANLFLHDEPIFLEYANCEPSSKDGVNDIVEKVERYNEVMKLQDEGKVLFIFRERSMVENFVNRIAHDFPYLWPHITDLESIKHNPTGKIFWTPKDFDQRTHALLE
jgi:Replication-relaxation